MRASRLAVRAVHDQQDDAGQERDPRRVAQDLQRVPQRERVQAQDGEDHHDAGDEEQAGEAVEEEQVSKVTAAGLGALPEA